MKGREECTGHGFEDCDYLPHSANRNLCEQQGHSGAPQSAGGRQMRLRVFSEVTVGSEREGD
jgi:hypothetical protein